MTNKKMNSSRLLSFFAWLLLLLLAVPSFLILSSWNSLPGDSLYGIKRGLEDVLLTLVSPNQNLSSNLSIKYSERRFIEATSLISEKHSIVGLASFEQQMQTAQQNVSQTKDTKEQDQLKTQLVNNLVAYQQQLQETKTQITSSNTNNPVATENPAVSNSVSNIPSATITPTVVVVTSTPVPKREPEVTKSVVTETPVTLAPIATTSNSVQPATNAQIVTAIDQTQEHITKTIKELEKEHSDNNSDQKNKDMQDNGQNKEQNKNHQGRN